MKIVIPVYLSYSQSEIFLWHEILQCGSALIQYLLTVYVKQLTIFISNLLKQVDKLCFDEFWCR